MAYDSHARITAMRLDHIGRPLRACVVDNNDPADLRADAGDHAKHLGGNPEARDDHGNATTPVGDAH
jgi:hypothetical protein